ncbi:MAG: alpha/beta hydrolase, partial [Eubacteriales bacterium]|nr:alpha/beta hydrolase [Eubacteriales bacterium]
RWFARLQFKALKIKEELFEEYFRDTCAISKANMIAFLEANASYAMKDALADCTAWVSVFVGAGESGAMRKSAERICQKLPGSALQILPGMAHGEFSINHADAYADAVRGMIAKEKRTSL